MAGAGHRPAQHAHALAVPVKLQEGELLQAVAVVLTHRRGGVVRVAAPLLTELVAGRLVWGAQLLRKYLVRECGGGGWNTVRECEGGWNTD